MRRLFPMALLAAAVFGTDAEAAVRVYRPTEQSHVVLQLGSSAGESQLAQLRAASVATPNDVDATLRYVDALMEAGAQTGNERVLGEILEINGRDREALLMRAQVRLHLHEPQQALDGLHGADATGGSAHVDDVRCAGSRGVGHPVNRPRCRRC